MGTLNIIPTVSHKFYLKSTLQSPEFLKEFKHCLTDEVLDSVVVYYTLRGEVVFTKLVINIYNLPFNVIFDAFYLEPHQHREMLSSVPICEPVN